MTRIRLDQFRNETFDRGAPRWKEVLWRLASLLFVSTIFPWPSAFKRRLLCLFGSRIGVGFVLRPGVHIHFPWRLRVGDHVWIGEGARLLNLDLIELGSHVCVSQEAFLCTGSHNFHLGSFDLVVKPIHVGDHSWIGARAFVCPGVAVGEGCKIDACAVVSADVEAGGRIRSRS